MLPKVLILGGTGDARALAALLVRDGRFEPVSSLAGRTREPLMPEGTVRIGGFGGAQGLAAYLRDEDIRLVVDATHPFAEQISAHAHQAARTCSVPLVRLERPAWKARPGDRWRLANSVADAAAMLEPGTTALVTVGRQRLSAFAERTDVQVVARMIEAPDSAPEHVTVLVSRPPYSLEEEMALIRGYGIKVLVTKNSGGEGMRAKLDAASDNALPVIMVKRPVKPPAPTAASPTELVELIVRTLAL